MPTIRAQSGSKLASRNPPRIQGTNGPMSRLKGSLPSSA